MEDEQVKHADEGRRSSEGLGLARERSLPERLRILAGEPWPFDVPDPDFGMVHRTMREAADELERKSDALQRLWLERDELRSKATHPCHEGCSLSGCVNERLRRLVAELCEANEDASLGTVRLLTARQEFAWRALLDACEA